MKRSEREITVLDCTLRDGGFYNEWDFSEQLVHAYVHAMDESGVDVAELGYRSPERARYVGALGYTPEWFVDNLPTVKRLRFGVMIEAKDFRGREALVGTLFTARNQSRLSLVRIATAHDQLPTAVSLAARLREMGYETTINLMAVTTLTDAQIDADFRQLDSSSTEIVYFADSFGSMYPDDIRRCAGILKRCSSKPWGVHLHNNLELAFANAMEAAVAGAQWIDTSITGMGRGPGNLRTELFLQHLVAGGESNRDPAPVYDFIGRFMQPLLETYRWGPGPAYILSAFLGVHPTYAQRLLSTARYSVGEVQRVLQAVHSTERGGAFDSRVLSEAISTRHSAGNLKAGSVVLPVLGANTAPWTEKSVLIVGRGPSATAQLSAINAYIAAADPIVIECNHVPGVKLASSHFCAFAVSANTREMAPQASASGKSIIVAADSAVEGLVLQTPAYVQKYAVREGVLTIDKDGLTLPADVVSMLALAVATRCGASRIDVVGFDGYDGSSNERDQRMQREMELFLDLVRAQLPGLTLRSLTRSSYTISQTSIYAQTL